MEKKIYIIDGTFSADVEAESKEDAKVSLILSTLTIIGY